MLRKKLVKQKCKECGCGKLVKVGRGLRKCPVCGTLYVEVHEVWVRWGRDY